MLLGRATTAEKSELKKKFEKVIEKKNSAKAHTDDVCCCLEQCAGKHVLTVCMFYKRNNKKK